MRDNKRVRQRFDLSLEGRQVVTIVAVLLAAVGGAFLLGVAVGRGLSDGIAEAPEGTSNPLAALDEAPGAIPGEEPPTRYSFHERLTRDAPRVELAAAPADDRAAAVAEPRGALPAAAPGPRGAADRDSTAPASDGATRAEAQGEKPAEAGAAGAEVAQPAPTLTAVARPAPGSAAPAAATGPFTIQLGATRDAGEAGRIAAKFKGWRPKIVGADVPGKGRWYRVRVGSFATREAADRYLRDLKRETGARGFVTAAR